MSHFLIMNRLKVVGGEIIEIRPDEKCVYLDDGKQIDYDELVIGLGCEDNYHDVPGAAENTYSIQTIGKSRVTYEKLLGLGGGATVGIVGAGLSGIELASELRESRPDLNIKLFDRSPRILRDFPERLSNYVKGWFDEHNVKSFRTLILRKSNRMYCIIMKKRYQLMQLFGQLEFVQLTPFKILTLKKIVRVVLS